MIIVDCPHCGKQHALLPDEIAVLIRTRKVVIACLCKNIYTVEQGNDRYFIK